MLYEKQLDCVLWTSMSPPLHIPCKKAILTDSWTRFPLSKTAPYNFAVKWKKKPTQFHNLPQIYPIANYCLPVIFMLLLLWTKSINLCVGGVAHTNFSGQVIKCYFIDLPLCGGHNNKKQPTNSSVMQGIPLKPSNAACKTSLRLRKKGPHLT